MLAELAVPVLAEHRTPTSYHSRHVAERYGLFTIIVLSEGVVATANSVIATLQAGDPVPELVALAAAVSAGIEVQIATIAEPGSASAVTARLAVAVPVALFILGVWAIVLRPHLGPTAAGACAVAAAVGLAAALLPLPAVALTSTVALVLAALVAFLLLTGAKAAPAQS